MISLRLKFKGSNTKKIILIGAAVRLESYLREHYNEICNTLASSDIVVSIIRY